MKLGIMQPYFFPYIGYWQLIHAVDLFIIYDDVNYIKKGWMHRNRVLINGKDTWLHLNIDHASQNRLINQVEIVPDTTYQKKLLKTLEHGYRRAPYYSDVVKVIERVIMQKERNLARYLEYEIRTICDYLSINTDLVVSSSIKKNNKLHGQDKIIEICGLLGSDEYINAIGGQGLYSPEVFSAHGIRLGFLETSEIRYKQFKNEYVPNLSIIDVLMFNDRDRIKVMLEDYKIVAAESFDQV